MIAVWVTGLVILLFIFFALKGIYDVLNYIAEILKENQKYIKQSKQKFK